MRDWYRHCSDPAACRAAPETGLALSPRVARPRGGPGWYSPGCCSRYRLS